MAAKSSNLIPVLLLGGLALVLLAARQRQAGGVTGAPATSTARPNDAARSNAIGQIVTGALSFLGGLTGGVSNAGNHSSAQPSPAALDQVIEAAQAWQTAYGGAAGVTGDPYNPE